MTDRELLEFAAKAAGMDFDAWSDRITDYDSAHYGDPALHRTGPGGQCNSWNPLTDDGDALRLAVRLDAMVDQQAEGVFVCMTTSHYVSQPYEGDKYAATRLAIVRVAAEIGKAMP